MAVHPTGTNDASSVRPCFDIQMSSVPEILQPRLEEATDDESSVWRCHGIEISSIPDILQPNLEEVAVDSSDLFTAIDSSDVSGLLAVDNCSNVQSPTGCRQKSCNGELIDVPCSIVTEEDDHERQFVNDGEFDLCSEPEQLELPEYDVPLVSNWDDIHEIHVPHIAQQRFEVQSKTIYLCQSKTRFVEIVPTEEFESDCGCEACDEWTTVNNLLAEDALRESEELETEKEDVTAEFKAMMEIYSCAPDGISKSGDTILIIKKDLKKGRNTTSNKRKIDVEAQAAMHICNATKCIIAHVDGDVTRLNDIKKQKRYFEKDIEEKISSFFDQFVSKKVFESNYIIKN